LWKAESGKTKEIYRSLAEKEQRIHQQKHPQYRYRPTKRTLRPRQKKALSAAAKKKRKEEEDRILKHLLETSN
jgi:hypothetical protein